jgi:uncharacterized LabA/DUF88 family protein
MPPNAHARRIGGIAISSGNGKKIVVFIDESNVYKDARRCFFNNEGPSSNGRIKPMRYAMLLADLQPLGTSEERELKEVRAYGGVPNRHMDLQTYSAHRRQMAEWERRDVQPIMRPLRYPADWPKSPAEQKGVDVQIALDVVVMGLKNEYDIAIIASTDTDLKPAIEGCHELGIADTCEIEVAAWRHETERKRIEVKDKHLWCHFLNRDDYDVCHDPKDYSIPNPEK